MAPVFFLILLGTVQLALAVKVLLQHNNLHVVVVGQNNLVTAVAVDVQNYWLTNSRRVQNSHKRIKRRTSVNLAKIVISKLKVTVIIDRRGEQVKVAIIVARD